MQGGNEQFVESDTPWTWGSVVWVAQSELDFLAEGSWLVEEVCLHQDMGVEVGLECPN